MKIESLNQELLSLLPGFSSRYFEVNGTSIHCVIGGQGEPLVLVPGYPETWWAYHKIMPALAEKYCVIVVEMRGMGMSAKPQLGYDKKNMAKDIYELVKQLSFNRIYIGGHDIGAHVAFSFACNYADMTQKLIMLDTPHPDEGMYHLPMLPIVGGNYTYPWWLAFNQVKELPEQLLEGRMDLVINWLFDHLLIQQESITAFDKQVYTTAYNSKEVIRASNAWYQAFPKDIEDSKSYNKLTLPVLGIGGSGYEILKMSLPLSTTDLILVKLKECGHFLLSEKPEEVIDEIIKFLA